MEVDGRWLRLRYRLQGGKSLLELPELGSDGSDVANRALCNCIDQSVYLALQILPVPLDRADPAPRLSLKALQFGVVFLQEGLDKIGLEKPVPQPVEDEVLDIGCLHRRLVGARSLLSGSGAAITAVLDDGEGAF
ncbi:MAG: hypothetical protein VW547_13355, partial [Alphaproteobacteria bacterium]